MGPGDVIALNPLGEKKRLTLTMFDLPHKCVNVLICTGKCNAGSFVTPQLLRLISAILVSTVCVPS